MASDNSIQDLWNETWNYSTLFFSLLQKWRGWITNSNGHEKLEDVLAVGSNWLLFQGLNLIRVQREDSKCVFEIAWVLMKMHVKSAAVCIIIIVIVMMIMMMIIIMYQQSIYLNEDKRWQSTRAYLL